MTASPTRPTSISILLRLYPRDWRARYADEFATLLGNTALTPAKVLDIALGALDARWSGDYPSAAGDDRKVRRPMIDRLTTLLTAAGGLYFAALMAIVVVVAPAEASTAYLAETSPAYLALLLGAPVAMAALALGIAGLSLGRSGGSAIDRALGLVTSALAAGITLAIMYLFQIGGEGWSTLMALFFGFGAATGLVGLRIVLSGRDHLSGWVLLGAGAVGSALWLLAVLPMGYPPDATTLDLGIVTVAWGIVGLLRLRTPASIATAA